MNKKYWAFLLALLVQFLNPTTSFAREKVKAAVTYDLSGGRLGDNLIAYMHAKWISYKYHIPLLYLPFAHSNEFAFHNIEKIKNAYNLSKYQRVVHLRGNQTIDVNSSTLYIVPYFPESDCERNHFFDIFHQPFPHFTVEWKDPAFRAYLLEMLKPVSPLNLCEIKKDKINVAVHIRTGGDYSWDLGLSNVSPQKSPPESFYVEQLKTMCEMFPDKELRVHIFTDDSHPEKLASRLEECLAEDRVEFTYREQGNYYEANVLDDLFSMMQFDCLIRPESSFSIVASCLKDYKVLMHPYDFVYEPVPCITKVKIITSMDIPFAEE